EPAFLTCARGVLNLSAHFRDAVSRQLGQGFVTFCTKTLPTVCSVRRHGEEARRRRPKPACPTRYGRSASRDRRRCRVRGRAMVGLTIRLGTGGRGQRLEGGLGGRGCTVDSGRE